MAAVYLDGGLTAARDVFVSAWGEALVAASGAQDAEAKTALQEWAMARGLPVPTYAIVSRSGAAHAPMFTVSVTVQGYRSDSSSVTGIKFWLAYCMIRRPVVVSPVKAILATRELEANGLPASRPKPFTMLTTPGGRPTSSNHCASINAVAARKLLAREQGSP